jgi:hypothetical protein
MGTTVSRDGLYELIETQRDDGSYLHSYTSYSWKVVHRASGEEILRFGGSWNQDASKDETSGVKSVGFSEDGRAVIAEHFDSMRQRVELPVSVALSDDQWAIVFSYVDGRMESKSLRYERNPMMPPVLEAAVRKLAAERRTQLIARLGQRKNPPAIP